MTREEELELLIEEQRKDDAAKIVYPDVNGQSYAGSLNHETSEGATYQDSLGVIVDFGTGEEEVVSFLTRRRGDVLGFAARLEHGLASSYQRGCHCDKCKAASAAAMRDWRGRKKAEEPWHGTRDGYRRGCRCYLCRRTIHGTRYRYNKGCRCERCTSAHKQYQRRRRGLPEKIFSRPCACCGEVFKPWRHGKIYCTPRCAKTGAQRAYRRRKKAAT